MQYAALHGRSLVVLALLTAILLSVLILANAFVGLPLFVVVLITLVMVALQFLLAPVIMDFIYAIRWVQPAQLGPEAAAFLQQVCADHRIPVPRVGIINDGHPTAFTYGNWPGNARVVVSSGLLEVLDAEEVKAVVAHEVGHITHWDFVVMTLAAVVPMVLYYIYRTLIRVQPGGSGRNGGQVRAALTAAAVAALVLYYVSQYIVLFLSRVREYYADAFAARATWNPRALASALVKIAYGLVAAEERQQGKSARERAQSDGWRLAGAMNIFDLNAARALAAAAATAAATAGADPLQAEGFRRASRWERFHPWAWLCELQSTHPLAVHRIHRLSDQAAEIGQAPFFALDDEAPPGMWRLFWGDLFALYSPWAAVLVLAAGWLVANPVVAVLGAILAGVLLLRSFFFRYRSSFAPQQVLDLLGEVAVSAVRPVPCVLEGEIIGRGVPGYFLSEDLVLQDATGYILLDYRHPLRLLEWFFALFRARRLVGRRVRVYGWYRRAPVPFVEIRRVETDDGQVHTSHVYTVKLLGIVVLTGLLAAAAAVLI